LVNAQGDPVGPLLSADDVADGMAHERVIALRADQTPTVFEVVDGEHVQRTAAAFTELQVISPTTHFPRRTAIGRVDFHLATVQRTDIAAHVLHHVIGDDVAVRSN
jgi:hypothetical protein